jgi:Ca2+-binding RTX toxin-like protein
MRKSIVRGRGTDDVLAGTDAADRLFGRGGDDIIDAGLGDDHVVAGSGDDVVSGDGGDDLLIGNAGDDEIRGDAGDDKLLAGGGDDDLDGGEGDDKLDGGDGDDLLLGGDGEDDLTGGLGDDEVESGAGDDVVDAGGGDDHVLSLSWGGEPEIAQDSTAAKVEPDEPVSDDDVISGGDGADLFEFRWLIDAKDEILAEHTDADGDIDYQAVAGENGAVHDHWVETTGDKTVTDFDAAEGDSFAFAGHTLALDTDLSGLADADGDTLVDDTVLYFYSEQGGAGAHQGDRLGTVTFLDAAIDLAEVEAAIDANVFYGVEEPYSAIG